MKTLDVPFEQLKISKFNMRVREPKPDISHILPSVRQKGILVPPLIREEDGLYGVVYGRSRYFCVQAILDEGGSFGPVTCAVMEEGDDADALEASIIENYARRNPDPMTEHENFVHLLKMGRSLEGIGQTFGMTPATVKQRLALGNLVPRLRKAYRVGEIDDDTICHLTMASVTQQRDWLKLLDEGDAPMGRYVKSWLLGGAEISTKAALFPLEDYKGQIKEDLFGEDSYFRDPDLFWELQNTAIAAKADALREDGWDDVQVLEIGQPFVSWDMQKTPKKKGGHVYISVSHQGVVEIHEGWLTQKEARRIAKQVDNGAGETAKADAGQHPALTQTMENYLNLHRHALVRVALLENPLVAFRLLVAHALASSGNWRVKSDPQTARSEAVQASLQTAPAQAIFAAEKTAVEALTSLSDDATTEAVFARLLKLSDAEVLRVAVLVMADTLEAGGDMVDAVGVHLAVEARPHWQPDDTFFDLLRDRGTINALLAEVGGKPIAKANIAEKGKTQKAILRDFLSGTNGRVKVEGWCPGWMAFPYRELGKKPRAPKPIVPEAIAAE